MDAKKLAQDAKDKRDAAEWSSTYKPDIKEVVSMLQLQDSRVLKMLAGIKTTAKDQVQDAKDQRAAADVISMLQLLDSSGSTNSNMDADEVMQQIEEQAKDGASPLMTNNVAGVQLSSLKTV